MYTGALDEYYDKFGELEYRSLRLIISAWKYQLPGNAVVNYTEADIPIPALSNTNI